MTGCKTVYVIAVTCFWISAAVATAADQKPNILIILCDDLGVGDVHCYNAEHGKIKTPHIDQLASQGMLFTDAHSGSSVCTPTRYGLLTGRYSWRTKLQKGVVSGFQPCLISAKRPTIASFLKDEGYHTGIVGKWHLNMRFMSPDDTDIELKGKPRKWIAPVGATSPDGPIHRGFDFFFGIHHARSMKALIEQDTIVAHKDPISFLPACGDRAVQFIKQQAKEKKPFFLYLPLGSPHTPILPTKQWQGKSGLGPYADFVMQTDSVVGQVLKSLDENHLSQNTIVVFSSDNGCSKAAGITELAEKGHQVSAGYRGSKSDIWDGGHRVPFIVRWPGTVAAGSRSDQLIGLHDLFATLGDCIGKPVPANSCEDSVGFLSALKGEASETQRQSIIHHSISGHFAYRTKKWKLLLARASGGWSSPNEKNAPAAWPEAQLYDMSKDSAEQDNLFSSVPEVADELLQSLKQDVLRGRTTPGLESRNDIDKIKLWKSK